MIEKTPAEDYLSLHLIIGFIIALACGILFKLIADKVFHTPGIRAADAYAEQAAEDLNNPKLTTFMKVVTDIGNTNGMMLLSLITALLIYRTHSRRRFYAFATIMAGGWLLNVLLKLAFHRARPSFFTPLIGAHGYSFPSGHAMASTLYFGSLTYLVFIASDRHPVWRVIGMTSCVLAVIVISLSRVYLGVHYLSDVVAGSIAGLGWVAICVSGLQIWVRKRTPQRH